MKKITFIFIILSLSSSALLAQTTIPGGYVSGTWTAAGSPYLIQGDITIHADSSLNIKPAAVVDFQGHYRLSVEGTLLASGTAQDSIVFTAVDTLTGWQGIRIGEGADSTRLDYCIIEHGYTTGTAFTERGGGIYCASASTVISHCRISDNRAYSGGGIYVNLEVGSDPFFISHCIIANNQAEENGGGLGFRVTELILSDCLFEDNQCGLDGGGLYGYGFLVSSVEITGCKFLNNTAQSEGGGVKIYHVQNGDGININDCEFKSNQSIAGGGGLCLTSIGEALITNCSFSGNWDDWKGGSPFDGGGAIYISSGVPTISSCIFDNNWANNAAAIYSKGNILVESCTFSENIAWTECDGLKLEGDAIIVNSIILGTSRAPLYFVSGIHSVQFCDIFGYRELFRGMVPAGLGEITAINANGDSCDTYSNIFLDPLFADPAIGDYHLTWANWPISDSIRSPAIDAGNPASPQDPDHTITDMGALYFNQFRSMITISDSLLDFGMVDIGQSLDLPLIIRNSGVAALQLQNVFNQHSVFTHNWNPADTLSLPGDSLIITVTFAPVDTQLVKDSLMIENNDRPIQVQLSGKGKLIEGIARNLSLPKVYALYPAYPNPFNSSTKISWQLAVGSFVKLAIYDLTGREVMVLVNEKQATGTHQIEFDARDLVSGVYLYRLQAGDPWSGSRQRFVETRKMILIR